MSDQIIQGTDEWKELRRGRATGSNFDACMAKGKGKEEASTRAQYRVRLAIERLTGRVLESNFKSKDMLRGTENEPFARMAYEAQTGYIVDEVPFIPHKFLMAGISPDGLVGPDGMTEFKCPTPAVHWSYLQLTDQPPPEYKWQVYGEMWVSGRQWVDFVSYNQDFPLELQLHIVRVHRDERAIQAIAELDAGVSLFLADVEKTVASMKEEAAKRRMKG